MQGHFIQVYKSTPDRRRVMFVWLYNSRLKVEPLSLVAFCIFHPGTKEYHSYLFTEAYNFDLRRELSSFINHVSDYQEFSRIAKLSQDRFCALLKTCNFPEFDIDSESFKLW